MKLTYQNSITGNQYQNNLRSFKVSVKAAEYLLQMDGQLQNVLVALRIYHES